MFTSLLFSAQLPAQEREREREEMIYCIWRGAAVVGEEEEEDVSSLLRQVLKPESEDDEK